MTNAGPPGPRGDDEQNSEYRAPQRGRGAPFLDLDPLEPDAIVIETSQTWHVYRMLGDRATGDVGGDADGIPGRQIVDPVLREG